jgi:hypothetical protein
MPCTTPASRCCVLASLQVSKAQGIQGGDRSCPHRKNIAVDPPYPGCSPLEGLDSGRVIMRFDLEHYPVAAADIHQPGILFPGLYKHLFAFPGERLQPFDRVFITAVLAPHGAEGT